MFVSSNIDYMKLVSTWVQKGLIFNRSSTEMSNVDKTF